MLYCANRDTDNLVIFKRSKEDGTIKCVKKINGVSMPVCVCPVEY